MSTRNICFHGQKKYQQFSVKQKYIIWSYEWTFCGER